MQRNIIQVVVGALVAVGSARAQNLLINGSFEQGPEIPYWGTPGYLYVTIPDGDTEIPGWIVKTPSGSGDIDYVRDDWRASDGFYSLDLCGNNAGGIVQTFTSVVGQSYAVTFDIAANPTAQGYLTPKTIEVSAAGQSERFSHDNAGQTQEDMGWATHTWLFTAGSTATEL